MSNPTDDESGKCFFCGKAFHVDDLNTIKVTVDDSVHQACGPCIDKGMEDGRIAEGEE